jgi:hypothetical protein
MHYLFALGAVMAKDDDLGRWIVADLAVTRVDFVPGNYFKGGSGGEAFFPLTRLANVLPEMSFCSLIEKAFYFDWAVSRKMGFDGF